jgi:citrate lyase subunit beta/citryl-CoA lyase
VSLPRSYLYVPGNAPDKLEKALGRGADALIVDLEDAVPLAEKDSALAAVLDWLSGQDGSGPELWVRVNAGPRRLPEVSALAGLSALTGIVLAKTESAAELAGIAEAAGIAEVAGIADVAGTDGVAGVGEAGGARLLMPMVETAGGVLDARALASTRGVRQLQVGEVDLAAELGLDVSADETELTPYRSLVVLGSAAAGIAPPPAPVSREIRDLDRFADSTRRLMRQGFHGRVCIHPAQVEVVHQLLTPTAAQLEEAQEVLDLLSEAEARGTGVVVDSAGRLVDAAVVRSAQRLLALAERA